MWFFRPVISNSVRCSHLQAKTGALSGCSRSNFSGLYGEESQPRQLESVDDAVVTFVKDEGTDFFKLVWNEGSVKNILSGPGDTTDLDIAEVYRKLRGK